MGKTGIPTASSKPKKLRCRIATEMIASKVFLFLVLLKNCIQTKRFDICSTGQVRIFLRVGESGVLEAYNVTDNRSGPDIGPYGVCQLEIVTCASCVVSLTFETLNLSCYCGPRFNLFFYNPCRCDYVWITEPPYEESGTSYCRMLPDGDFGPGENDFSYRSKTRTVRVSLFYTRSHFHAFTLDYKSEPNRQFLFATSDMHSAVNLSRGRISSPFFPAPYPRDFISEYVVTCITRSDRYPVTDFSCRVRLIFSDFQLASSSIIEFYDGSHRIHVISGASFRPPVIISTTNTLSLRFFARGENNLGFKALFSFVSGDNIKNMLKPITDCGGFVENFGGTITMMNMAHDEPKLYDCIWLIKPLKTFFNVKTHLYLKVATFLNFAGEAELQVRRGLTSESPTLVTLRHPVPQIFEEHVFPLTFGYYVNLRAFFGPASHLAIAYASLNYNHCFVFSDFSCQNFRCISKKLNCDGFDHCGDNSDELSDCFQVRGVEPTVGRWFTHAPNYYFPKIKAYSDFQSALLILLSSLAGLIFLAFALSVIFYRMGTRERRRRAFQNQFDSLSDVRDVLSEEVSVENIVIDDPPRYEPPPNYEDVIKSSEIRSTESGKMQRPNTINLTAPMDLIQQKFPKKLRVGSSGERTTPVSFLPLDASFPAKEFPHLSCVPVPGGCENVSSLSHHGTGGPGEVRDWNKDERRKNVEEVKHGAEESDFIPESYLTKSFSSDSIPKPAEKTIFLESGSDSSVFDDPSAGDDKK